MGTLLWAGFNFGLYASANNFSLAGTLADLLSSALCVTFSSGFAAWLLHAQRRMREATPLPDEATPAFRTG